MTRSKEYKAFKDSLQQSLNNCQYENLGMPFDKDAQLALCANEFGTMTEFMDKLEQMTIEVVDKAILGEYVKSVYEEVTRFGVLFFMLSEDYKRETGNSRMTYDLYYLTLAYTNAIEEAANEIRNVAAKQLKIDLVPFTELTLDSYNIHGRFIQKLNQKPDLLTDSPKTDPFTDSEKKQFVRSILAPLGGVNPQRQLIMNRTDFERLLNYTDYLVLADSLPNEIFPIAKTGISNEHIRYTFYRLHKALFGKGQINNNFIEFIHAVFKQFVGTANSTTKGKFSTPPSSYEKDFAG